MGARRSPLRHAWGLVLLGLLLISMPLVSSAQDLDDYLDRPPDDQGVVTPPTGGANPAAGSPDLFNPVTGADVYHEFGAGILSLEQLIGFLQRVLTRLIALIHGQPVPGPGPIPAGPQVNVPPSGPGPQDTPGGTGRPETLPSGPPQGRGPRTPGAPPPVTPPPAEPTDPSEPSGPAPSGSGVAAIPARPAEAETGSEFLRRTETLSPADREQEIRKAILDGNVAPFLRRFCEVRVSMKLKDGQSHTAVFRCLPDYLAIGTDEDFVRIPMSPIAAQAIADRFGCLLPTSKMVDEIFKQASTQLYPQPMSGGQYPNWQARMTRNEFYREHHRLVEGQRTGTGHQLGQLLAGHKKDVLISNFLNTHPKNVVIYGWHDKRNQGKPIQGYGFSHENTYADYSHGIRLISRTVTVDGQDRPMEEVLGDPVLSRLLSNEGPVRDLRAVR